MPLSPPTLLHSQWSFFLTLTSRNSLSAPAPFTFSSTFVGFAATFFQVPLGLRASLDVLQVRHEPLYTPALPIFPYLSLFSFPMQAPKKTIFWLFFLRSAIWTVQGTPALPKAANCFIALSPNLTLHLHILTLHSITFLRHFFGISNLLFYFLVALQTFFGYFLRLLCFNLHAFFYGNFMSCGGYYF